jgi:hypothetical protein
MAIEIAGEVVVVIGAVVRARLDNFGNCPLRPEGAFGPVGQAKSLWRPVMGERA